MSRLHTKIIDLQRAMAWRERCRRERVPTVITNGCFDLLHPGHVDYLARCADIRVRAELLVLLNSDHSIRALKGPHRPIMPQADRALILAALQSVTYVHIFDAPRCTRELLILQPDIYIKAGDYTYETLDRSERAALDHCHAAITFLPLLAGYSTTGLLDRIAAARAPLAQEGRLRPGSPLPPGSAIPPGHTELPVTDPDWGTV